MTKKIAWESWNAQEDELISINSDHEDDFNEDDMEEVEAMHMPMIISYPTKHIQTPFGNYDPESPFIPSKRWECWVGHTNFDITTSVVEILNTAPGVESLIIMGRYTFCIGIAKLFDSTEVKENIKNLLTLEITQESIDDITEEIIKLETIQKNAYWSVLINDKGEISDYAVSQEYNDEYIKAIKELEHLKEKNGGQIFCS